MIHGKRNNQQFLIRKRIIVICETSKCRYTFLACFIKELGEAKFGTMTVPTFSLMFGGYGTSSTSTFSSTTTFSTISSSLEFLQSQDEGGGSAGGGGDSSSSSSSADFLSSGGGGGGGANNNGSGVGGVLVVTIVNAENTVAYELVLIDSSSGLICSALSNSITTTSSSSSSSPTNDKTKGNIGANSNNNSISNKDRLQILSNPTLACLEPLVCDIDTKACVVCCEGPDVANLGMALGEKYTANYLASTAETILELLFCSNSSSSNALNPTNINNTINYNNNQSAVHHPQSSSIKLSLCVVGWGNNAPDQQQQQQQASPSKMKIDEEYHHQNQYLSDDYCEPNQNNINTSDGLTSLNSATRTAASLSSSSTSSLTSPSQQFSSGHNNNSNSSSSSSSSSSSKVWIIFNIAFDYIFRWTKLILSIFLFGLNQRVVSWKDQVSTVREAVQFVGSKCGGGTSNVNFSGLCILDHHHHYQHSHTSSYWRSEDFKTDSDFGRFVASLR